MASARVRGAVEGAKRGRVSKRIRERTEEAKRRDGGSSARDQREEKMEDERRKKSLASRESKRERAPAPSASSGPRVHSSRLRSACRASSPVEWREKPAVRFCMRSRSRTEGVAADEEEAIPQLGVVRRQQTN